MLTVYSRILNITPAVDKEIKGDLISDGIICNVIKDCVNVRSLNARIWIQQHIQ